MFFVWGYLGKNVHKLHFADCTLGAFSEVHFKYNPNPALLVYFRPFSQNNDKYGTKFDYKA